VNPEQFGCFARLVQTFPLRDPMLPTHGDIDVIILRQQLARLIVVAAVRSRPEGGPVGGAVDN